MKNLINEKRNEEYLFKIARRILDWVGVSMFTEKELADLVMQDLLNIEKEVWGLNDSWCKVHQLSYEVLKDTEKEVKIMKKGICLHCKKEISIRNPSGYCDHLYYPDNCKICKKLLEEKQEKNTEIFLKGKDTGYDL